eukprot:CAMPEP_0168269078 /NCGR_PEP_ID=MMETSP0141_2-20121125/14078_1 /TAXON_ID=44445 /ORGANISM="Pseudo-nitzschia australis, Strain 10249 10 AB" /LENGTH=614 /DNA_ID=CAMNT_0008209585 /DNA_START=99 /DNA_END=1944 /DNA_ORIENTATION=-
MNRFRSLAVVSFLFAFALTAIAAASEVVVTVSSGTSNLSSATIDSNDSSNNDNDTGNNDSKKNNSNDNSNDNNIDDDDNGNSFNMHYNYIPHEGNSTLSATFSIRVTPEHYHMLSWTILWMGFVSAVLLGCTSSGSNTGSPQDPELGGGSGSGGNNNGNGNGMRTARGKGIVRSNRGGSRMTLSSSTASLTNSSNPANLGDEQPVSSGDLARATFRRLILIAMASRTVAIPIQIYSDPLWVQLIADTFPVMTFATAWTWLVSFFVQLVGVALGSTNNIGTSTTNSNSNFHSHHSGGGSTGCGGIIGGGGPSSSTGAYRPAATIVTVIQITSYVVYALLIIAFTIFRRIAAAVLLYALLCCVYATLLGTALYFCPRLLGLLLPGLDGKWYSPLSSRLVACSGVSLLVFAARTFCFAKKVVQSTTPLGNTGGGPYWWFQYGALELLPGLMFLVLLHPKRTMAPATPNNSKSGGSNSSGGGRNNATNTSTSATGGFGGGDELNPHPSGRRTPPLYASYQRSDSNDSKPGAATTSPIPHRSHTPPPPPMQQPQQQQQQQTMPNIIIGGGGGKSKGNNPNQEIAPLLGTNSNSNRYGSSAATNSSSGDTGVSIDVILNQ